MPHPSQAKWQLGLATAVATTLLHGSAALSADTEGSIPNFSSTAYGWIASGPNFIPPETGPRPVAQDPAYPYRPNGGGEAPSWRIADLTNPILQPWAREELKKRNERILAGMPGYTRQVSCWPIGVPTFLLYPVAPIYFVQTPKEVVIMSQFDHQVRRIYLNVPHSERVKPSWYGESVGHYEGDTLVVDTIGLNDQTYVDNFRTPHSDKLHVVERFRMTNGGKSMEAIATVDDPGAFTTSWSAVQRYTRADQEFLETNCAENNFSLGDMEPMPVATKADF